MLIEGILRNFDTIRLLRNYGRDTSLILPNREDVAIDQVLYIDLYLDIQKAIEASTFTEEEYNVLCWTMDGYNYSEISNYTGLNRAVIAECFKRVCLKLRQSLSSGYKTDFREEIHNE